jgi:hypothetical protein
MLSTAAFIILSLTVGSGPAGATGQKVNKASKAVTASARTALSILSSEEVEEIGVYPYDSKFSDLLLIENRRRIEFKIKDDKSIGIILDALNYKERDGSNLFITPTAYVFFRIKDHPDQVIEGKIVGGWQFLMLDDDYRQLYPIPEQGSQILKRNLCVKHKD